MISALFAGNACVIKVSEHTSWSSKIYESIVHKALVACGHSPDLFRVVTGFAEAGQSLISARLDKITFIGSPKVGKMVIPFFSFFSFPFFFLNYNLNHLSK